MRNILLLLCCALCLTASAQKTTKLYNKIQKAQDKKDYFDMVDLLEKLPPEEKSGAQYNKLMALSLDSLHRYASTIKYYSAYVALTNDSAAAKRLAFIKDSEEKRIKAWRAKMERIKDCPKCHGTDSATTETVCTRCEGTKKMKVRCRSCTNYGKSPCSACGGRGAIESGNGNSTTCSRCGGMGSTVCPAYCDHGYNPEDCKYCGALGYVLIQVKCDKHE